MKSNSSHNKIHPLLSFLLMIILMMPVAYSLVIFEKSVADNFLVLNNPLEEENKEESHTKKDISEEYTLPFFEINWFGSAGIKKDTYFSPCFLIVQQGVEVITPPPEYRPV